MLSDGAAAYTPGLSQRVSSTSSFFHGGIKNTDTQTSSGKSVTATRVYYAFGNVASSTGTWSSPFGYAGPFGYQEDSASGLKLLGHRYYDSSTGRFLSRDPVKDGRNWYTCCANNPIKHADPTGLKLRIENTSYDEWWAIMLAIIRLGNTKNGHDLVDHLLHDEQEYVIIVHTGNTITAGNVILLNVTDINSPYLGTDGKYHNFELIGIIGHELGHLVGGIHGSDHEQQDVDDVENPILGELGLPTRGDYSKFKPAPVSAPVHIAPGPRFPW